MLSAQRRDPRVMDLRPSNASTNKQRTQCRSGTAPGRDLEIRPQDRRPRQPQIETRLAIPI